jgi:hypothetical protein
MMESFVLLSTVGGDCIDDLLQWDKGLPAMYTERTPDLQI